MAFLENRIVFMDGDFDEDTCLELRKELLHLAGISPKPILLYISSYGGELYPLFSLMGVIKSMNNILVTVANGYVCSAGSYLHLMGDERFATPDTVFMYHELSGGSYRKLHDNVISVEASKKIQKVLNKLVEKQTKIKNAGEWLKDDKYLNVNEAFKIGAVTNKKKFIPNIKITEKKNEDKKNNKEKKDCNCK